MTFKKINENEQNNIHDRSCIILVNFNNKEVAAIKTVSSFAGIKDRIVLTSKNGNTKIKDILDGNISDDNENTWNPPESVKIGLSQFINLCNPPIFATTLSLGLKCR